MQRRPNSPSDASGPRRGHKGSAPGGAPPILGATYRPGRDTLITSLSLIVVSASGAVASLLLVLIAGGGPETDAIVAGYSLFLIISLFAATIRPILVPIIGSGPDETLFRTRASDVAGRVALLGLVAAALVAALAPAAVLLMSGTIAPSQHGRLLAALLILAPAGWLQLNAAACSAVLASAGRFTTSAGIYAGSAIIAVGATAGLLPLIGPLGLPLGTLIGSIPLAVGHEGVLRRFRLRLRTLPRRLGERDQWRFAWDLSVSAATPLAWHAQLAIALACVSSVTGEVTAYAYGYFIVYAFLVAPAAASMVTLPQLVREPTRYRAATTADYLVRVVPGSLFVTVTAAATTIAFGGPVVEWAVGGPLGQEPASRIIEVVAALSGLLVANTLVAVLWPLAGSLGRQRQLAVVALGSVLALIAGGLALRGDTVHIATWQSVVSIAAAAATVGVLLGEVAASLVVRLARASLPSATSVLIISGMRVVGGEGSGPAGALLRALVALTIVLVVTVWVWPALLANLPGFGRITRRGRASTPGDVADGS